MRAFLPIIAAIVVLALAGGQDVAEPSAGAFSRPYCPAEDVCRVDYARGGWRLMECEGACDDKGARTTWARVYVGRP